MRFTAFRTLVVFGDLGILRIETLSSQLGGLLLVWFRFGELLWGMEFKVSVV